MGFNDEVILGCTNCGERRMDWLEIDGPDTEKENEIKCLTCGNIYEI